MKWMRTALVLFEGELAPEATTRLVARELVYEGDWIDEGDECHRYPIDAFELKCQKLLLREPQLGKFFCDLHLGATRFFFEPVPIQFFVSTQFSGLLAPFVRRSGQELALVVESREPRPRRAHLMLQSVILERPS